MSAGDIVTIDLGEWASWAVDLWDMVNQNGLFTVLVACAVGLFILAMLFRASRSQGTHN